MNGRKKWILPAGFVSAGIIVSVFAFFWIGTAEALYWKTGAAQTYSFSYESSLKMTGANGAGTSKVKIEGNLNFRIYSVSNSTVNAAFQFSPVKVYFADKEIVELQEMYSRYFTAQFKTNGEIERYTFANTISSKDEAMIKDLLAHFMPVLSTHRKRVWRSEQENASGSFICEYRNGQNGIYKRKLHYEQIKSFEQFSDREQENAYAAEVEIIESNIFFGYGNPYSWIREARGHEIEIFHLQNDTRVEAVSRFNLQPADSQPDQSLAIWNNDNTYDRFQSEVQNGLNSKEKLSFWEKEKLIYLKNKYSTISCEEVLNLFLSKEKAQWDDKIFVRDYLRLYPEQSDAIIVLLYNKGLSTSQQAGLIHILELADTPESQNTLVSIAKDTGMTHDNRLRAVVALSGIDTPTPAMITELSSVYDNALDEQDEDMSNTAVLALGNLSNTLALTESDDEAVDLSEKLKTKITSELTNENANTAAVLLAIENTRDSELAKYASGYIYSEDPNVRSAAASAFAVTDSRDAPDVLINAITSEHNDAVKESMIHTLRKMQADSGSFNRIHDLVKTEDSESVRKAMINYLVENRDKTKSDAVFKEMLRDESSPAARVLLYRAIYSKGNLSRNVKAGN